MPIQFDTKTFTDFIDWFGKISPTKKIYALIIAMGIGLLLLFKYYDTQIRDINTIHNNRIDSISRYYTHQLEKCNTENKEEYFKIIQILRAALQEQEKLEMQNEELKEETEKMLNN